MKSGAKYSKYSREKGVDVEWEGGRGGGVGERGDAIFTMPTGPLC